MKVLKGRDRGGGGGRGGERGGGVNRNSEGKTNMTKKRDEKFI